jgi:hypothetical protein
MQAAETERRMRLQLSNSLLGLLFNKGGRLVLSPFDESTRY